MILETVKVREAEETDIRAIVMLLNSCQHTKAHEFFKNCGFSSKSKIGFVKCRKQFGHEGKEAGTQE